MQTEVEAAALHQKSHAGMYVTVGIASLVLTAIAFYVVFAEKIFHPFVVPIILVLAAVQVFLQTWLFMHLNTGRRPYQLFFGYGVFLACLVILGSVEVLTSYHAPVAKPKKLTPAQMVVAGQKIVTSECVACHTVNGKGGTIGPNLNQVMAGKINLVPGGKPTSVAWLTTWIANPPGVWSHALMPNLGLNSQQVQSVVKYLTLKVK